MNKNRVVLIAGAAVICLAGAGEAGGREITRPPAAAEARVLFPDTAELILEGEDFYSALDEAGKLLGFVVQGPPAGHEPAGYAGPVPFLVGLDRDLRITGVHLLPSRETGSYVRRVADRLAGAWNNLAMREAATREVDTLTGATMTSEALITGVRKTMSRVAEEHDRSRVDSQQPTPVEPGPEAHAPEEKVTAQVTRTGVLRRSSLWLALLVFLAALARFFRPAGLPGSRLVYSAVNFLVPGVLAATMVSLVLLGGWADGGFSAGRHWFLLLVTVAAFGIPLASGRNFYCFYFCPFGAAQDLSGRAGGKKIKPGRRLSRAFSVLRAFLIIVFLLSVLAGLRIDLALVEPFAAFHWRYAAWPTRALAFGGLLAACLVPRCWCRICPTGGLITLTVKIARAVNPRRNKASR